MKSVTQNPVFKICLKTMLLCTAIFFQSGCQKETQIVPIPENTHNDFAFTTKDVSVKNMMLAFKNIETFKKVMTSLHELAEDKEFAKELIASRKAAANTRLNGTEEPNLTDGLLSTFAGQFDGYLSLYQAERTAEDVFLENGGDPADFDRSFVSDEYFQAVLNGSNEIMIGEAIFHYVDDYHVFIALDGDYATMTPVLETSDPFSVPESASLLFLDNRVLEDNNLYASIGGALTPSGCDFFVNVSVVGPSALRAELFGSGFGNTTHTRWTITGADGMIVAAESHYGPVANLGVPYGTAFPITITAKLLDGGCTGKSASKSIADLTPSCGFDFTFYEQKDAANTYNFYISRQPVTCCVATYTWDFGDGQTATTTGKQEVSHTYTDGESTNSRVVSVSVKNPAGCAGTLSKTILTGCGINQPEKTRGVSNPDFTNRGVGTIWMDNGWIYSSLGRKGVFYAKNRWGNYKRASTTAITMQWGGSAPVFFKGCSEQRPLNTSMSSTSNSQEIRDEWSYSYNPWSKTRLTARSGTIECSFVFPAITSTPVVVAW